MAKISVFKIRRDNATSMSLQTIAAYLRLYICIYKKELLQQRVNCGHFPNSSFFFIANDYLNDIIKHLPTPLRRGVWILVWRGVGGF